MSIWIEPAGIFKLDKIKLTHSSCKLSTFPDGIQFTTNRIRKKEKKFYVNHCRIYNKVLCFKIKQNRN